MRRNLAPAEASEGQSTLDQAAGFVAQRLVRLAGEIAAGNIGGLSQTAREVLATSALRLLVETAATATVLAPQTPLTQRLYAEFVFMKDDLTGLIQSHYPDAEESVLGPRIQVMRARYAPTPRTRG